ncbi:MAG: PfkB family carbohydrate kinase [Armatimonadota bacterium]
MLMTFGELMLRISPAGDSRLASATMADIAFGGAECNVAVAAARMGTRARYVTALPDNALADAAIMRVRSFGVDTEHMHSIPGRIGIYFVEPASGLQPASVIYDRAGSAVTHWHPTNAELDNLLVDVTHFHFSGITVAIGGEAVVTLVRILDRCKERGIHVSLDVNYRMKLWTVESARDGLTPLMTYVDTLICNENHARLLFDCAIESDLEKANLLHVRLPELTNVVVSRRRAADETHDAWCVVSVSATGQSFESTKRNIHMIERVGGGDAFAGAFLSELICGCEMEHCLNFGAAALALKHGIRGDFCTFQRKDVENVLRANSTSGVFR